MQSPLLVRCLSLVNIKVVSWVDLMLGWPHALKDSSDANSFTSMDVCEKKGWVIRQGSWGPSPVYA